MALALEAQESVSGEKPWKMRDLSLYQAVVKSSCPQGQALEYHLQYRL